MAASGCLHFFSATKQNLWLHFEQDPLFVVEFWPLFWPSNNYKSFHTANKFIIALVSFCICDLTFLKTEVNFFSKNCFGSFWKAFDNLHKLS